MGDGTRRNRKRDGQPSGEIDHGRGTVVLALWSTGTPPLLSWVWFDGCHPRSGETHVTSVMLPVRAEMKTTGRVGSGVTASRLPELPTDIGLHASRLMLVLGCSVVRGEAWLVER